MVRRRPPARRRRDLAPDLQSVHPDHGCVAGGERRPRRRGRFSRGRIRGARPARRPFAGRHRRAASRAGHAVGRRGGAVVGVLAQEPSRPVAGEPGQSGRDHEVDDFDLVGVDAHDLGGDFVLADGVDAFAVGGGDEASDHPDSEDGEVDEYPEAAFNLVGTIDEAIEYSIKILKEKKLIKDDDIIIHVGSTPFQERG